MESFNQQCLTLQSVLPEASQIVIRDPQTLAPSNYVRYINTFMSFCTRYPLHILNQPEIIWDFLYLTSDIIRKHDIQFNIQDTLELQVGANKTLEKFEDIERVPLRSLPKRS